MNGEITLYFTDELHKQNYDLLLKQFPLATKDVERQVGCYISAVPMIFFKIKDKISDYKYPLDWLVYFQMKEDYEEGNIDEDELDDFEKYMIEKVDYHLTFSMKQLGRLGLNLFNGYDNFNLMDCINSLDDKNIFVLKTAIDVRLGEHKEQ